MTLLNKEELPTDFEYPSEFLKIVDQNLVDIEPWQIMRGDYLSKRFLTIKKHYPNRTLIPFARRLDNDDLACWDLAFPNKVVIIHDFASSGWEQRKIFDNFWNWFRQAIEDLIEHNSEN